VGVTSSTLGGGARVAGEPFVRAGLRACAGVAYRAHMITGIHTLVYSDDPEATRGYFRDVLGLPFIETSPGWLIFDTGPSEGGVHPRTWPGRDVPYPQRTEITLMCDDLDDALARIGAAGAESPTAIEEREYGRCVHLPVPGLEPMLLLEPSYAPAWSTS